MVRLKIKHWGVPQFYCQTYMDTTSCIYIITACFFGEQLQLDTHRSPSNVMSNTWVAKKVSKSDKKFPAYYNYETSNHLNNFSGWHSAIHIPLALLLYPGRCCLSLAAPCWFSSCGVASTSVSWTERRVQSFGPPAWLKAFDVGKLKLTRKMLIQQLSNQNPRLA